jgi:IS605 OrfB family transposase
MRQYRKTVNHYLHELARGTPKTKIYQQIKQRYNLQTGLIQTARDIAQEQYDSYKNNPDNPRFPHFNGLMTIRYDHRSINFKHTPGKEFEWWANISTTKGRVHVPITGNPEHLHRLEEYRFKAVQLKYYKDSFYLNVIFEQDTSIPKEQEFEYFVGVDRGSHNNLATLVVQNRNGDIIESKFYPAGQLLEKRRRFLLRRQQLGRKKLLKKIKKSKNKEKQYVKDANHKISTDIVRVASKYPGCVIVLENLKGIRKRMDFGKKENRKGHSWPFLLLEEMIVYKAHRNSIAVRRVYPRDTSSVCRNCFGSIRRRPSIRSVCETCKKEYNGDWLGAVNIVRRFFYYRSKDLGISGSCPEQRKDDPGKFVVAPNTMTQGVVGVSTCWKLATGYPG